MQGKRNSFVLAACLVACWALAEAGTSAEMSALERVSGWTYDQGAVIRGDRTEPCLSLIFTGGEFGEGTEHILDTLKNAGVRASFFVTGDYIRRREHNLYLRRMVAEGHYLGPHSDSHPLYCSWEDRAETLVTRNSFEEDLRKNIVDLRSFGALSKGQPILFIPPFEWYNKEQVTWAEEMNVRLFNFTPGTGSNRDWAPPGHAGYASSEEIIEGILDYEQGHPDGLNGFLLLLHLGAQREDKVFLRLGYLVERLRARGYEFERVDELLSEGSPE